MHASIWFFRGDPDALEAAYDAMVARIPSDNMGLHLCLRSDDGLILIDTCRSRDAFVTFSQSDGFRQLRRSAGMPEPERLEDHPVHAAFVDGRRL